MKKILEKKLKISSKLILKKYKPKVIGITGSVGKTSTKEALFLALKNDFNVRATFKNFNNEIGLPLTIIGIEESPGKSFFGWFLVFLKVLNLLLFKNKSYPNLLILEMGIDKPGDMDYLLSIVKPDIAVVTSVSHSHLESFKKVEVTQKEKAKLALGVKKDGIVILNYDNPLSRRISDSCKAKTYFYGLLEGVSLRAVDIKYNFSNYLEEKVSLENIKGLNFKIEWQGSLVPVFLENVSNLNSIYSIMPAILVGLKLNINIVKLIENLKSINMPAGRLNIISGIKNTYLIDDTYNASPESTLAALDFLNKLKFKNCRRIAVLGEMLELGSFTDRGHKMVGESVHSLNIDFLFAVGEKARGYTRGAIEAGFSKDKIFYFNDSESAGRFLQEFLELNDIVLIKGSQGIRMERVVKEVMSEPLKAKDILVRQNKNWV